MTLEEKQLLDKMREKLEEQDEELHRLHTAPTAYAVVVRVDSGRATFVMDGGSLMEAQVPPGALIRPGTIVKTLVETGAIVEVEKTEIGVGKLATALKVIDPTHVEVETESGRRVVMVSYMAKGIKPGHRVLLDNTSNIITKNLGAERDSYKVPRIDPVTWQDIGGLAEAKRLLQEAIELPAKNPQIFARYDRKPLRGIMLYGPPGCGKTMLAKASYTAMSKLHGADTVASGFIYVKGPEIISKWVGESEAAVRSIFHQAREHYAEQGFPALIFLDEADAILTRRGSGHNNSAGYMSGTIVPQFLSEMDGMSGKGQPLVLIATNRPDTLDPAVVRDGRVDRKIRVDRPGRPEAAEIFRINLRKKPRAEDGLEEHGAQELMCSSRVIMQLTDHRGESHSMTLADCVNGAMVAGIVDRATELAMRRELDGWKGKQGISRADLTQGVTENMRQMFDIDLSDEVAHFAETRRLQVRQVARISP